MKIGYPFLTRRKKIFAAIRLAILSGLACSGSACSTGPNGEKEGPGQTLQRMDQSLENTIDRLQNKTYGGE